MSNLSHLNFHDLDEDAVVRAILEGTATKTGEDFFAALVENLSKALDTQSAWVTEFIEKSRRLRALAFYADGELIPNFEIDIDGTPCEAVVTKAQLVHYPDKLIEFFPKGKNINRFHAASYMGVPLLDAGGKVLGNLAVLDTRPMPEEPRSLAIFQIFATRASAELQRLYAGAEIKKREEKYRRIVETAAEGFLLMDEHCVISDLNEAFCNMIGYSRDDIIGKTPFDFSKEDDQHHFLINPEEIQTGGNSKFESIMVSKDGRPIPVLMHRSTLSDDRGITIGSMAFVTDITDQKKSLALAGEIQKSLLPHESPRIQGLDIAGRNDSCDEIGGDYFDFLWGQECSNNNFDAVVGDVTGHGVDAALLMTTARAFLRMRASQCGGISQIVTEMNRHLTRDILNTGRFMTLFYISVDPQTKTLQWVRAGHDPAIIYDPAQKKFEELKGDGLALGVDENFSYQEHMKTGLESGQIIAIGTDGIWETFNQNGDMFGKERFRQIIQENSHLGANQIVDAVYNELNRFSNGAKTKDDITLVIMKIQEAAAEREDWQI
jgi:PAS domain S-box-containing protein